MTTGALILNGFEIELPLEVDVVVRFLPNPSDVKPERERLGDHWFVHWLGGKLYAMRLQPGGPNVEGQQQKLKVADHPWLLRSRVDDVIASVFSKYEADRLRPFSFLAQKGELVEQAAEAARVRHPLLSGFGIRPRFTLNAKVVEPRDGETQLGLFVTLSMRYEISAELSALQKAGVDLRGLYAIRRRRQRGERRLVGRIDRIENDQVHLTEADVQTTFAAADAQIEGSLDSFSRCLRTLLGDRYADLLGAIDDVQANFRLGPDFDKVVEQMGEFLRRKSPITLAPGFDAKIGKRLQLTNQGGLTSIYRAPPVDYVFDRSGARRDAYAWRGLQSSGPYDRTTFAKKSPRILVVFPTSAEGKVDVFLKALRDGMPPPQKAFSNGFAKTFGLVNLELIRVPVRLDGLVSDKVEAAYRGAIEAHLQKDSAIDAGIIVLLDEHAHLPPLHNPYIRTKALLLTLGVPTQVARMATITQRPGSLQYTLQNFSISLYAKLNGTPWTVDQDRAISDEIVLGMGVAELSESRLSSRQRFVGITTVFGGDGTYLLGAVSRECAFENYASALKDSMVAVLEDVRTRNNWQPGDTVRVIFHAHKPLKRIEVADIAFACAQQVGAAQNLQMAFVTVTHDHPFYLFDPRSAGVPAGKGSDVKKGVMAPDRGTIARIGRSTRLLAVNSGPLIKRANSPLPQPLLINLHPDSTFFDLDYLAEQVLKFTSLSWRSTLPAHTPVTIFYSERIAELLTRLRRVPDWSATALAVKLRWSRWFL